MTKTTEVLDFEIEHVYSELVGRRLLNEGFEDYELIKAVQNILFRLDQKGAVLRSEARARAALGNGSTPKRLILDKPFLLYLKEKGGEYPYFAIWIENAELMVED